MTLADIGSGKTHSIKSLAANGIECFVFATEPGIESVLSDTDPRMVHWHYLPPAPFSWDILARQIDSVNTKSYKDLCNENPPRNEFRQMLDFVNLCKNFRCERTGQSFGDIRSWDHNRAFVMDTFSGFTQMAINAWMGTRIGADISDYQVVQKVLLNQVRSLTQTLRCWFVMNCHLEKEMNETQGVIQQMASTYGRKLAPMLGQTFDEVILLKRDADKFTWSNNERNALLKKRLLPFGSALDPSYNLLVNLWRTANKLPKP